jgi:hypothetical protein
MIVSGVADAGEGGHGEGGELRHLVVGAGDPQGGPVALVSGVEQAAHLLVLLRDFRGAEEGVGLVDQQGRRRLRDRPEDRGGRGVDRDQRVVDRLGDHVQEPRFTAPLRRSDDGQAWGVLPRRLQVGGGHPQRHGREGFLARQYDVPADLRPQAGEYLLTLGGRGGIGLLGGRLAA